MPLMIGKTSCSASFLLKFFYLGISISINKVFKFVLDSDLDFCIMPKVKTTYAYKIQSVVKEFPDEFMESINNQLYCNLCNCAVFYNKRFLVDSHRNTSKHQYALGSGSENLILQFLRSSDTDFVEKITKAFLSANISLYNCTS